MCFFLFFLPFYSFLKGIKIIFLKNIKTDFQCEIHRGSFVTVPLLKKHTFSDPLVNLISIRYVSASQVQGPTPAPSLRLSGPRHCPHLSPRPRKLFTADELVLRSLRISTFLNQRDPWDLLARNPSVHCIPFPAWFVPRGMMLYTSLRIDVIFFPISGVSLIDSEKWK